MSSFHAIIEVMPTKSLKNKKSVRLETHVMPIRYAVTLHPDLEAHTFSGEVIIDLSISKATKEITLHSKDLNITSASISDSSKDGPCYSSKISYNDKMETASFLFSKLIPKGNAKLSITFRGVLASNMRGFYKSKYVVNGKEEWMATTQFEATDARRCIPCFDEPTHKAIFDVRLVVPTGKTAISNTLPIATKEHSAGYKVVSFAPTPKMSTYLLAFIVGDFEWIEKKTKSGVLVRIMTIPGKKHQAKFSLDVTVKSLEFYEKYFGIPYPLNTLDMIAVPDFSSLAMENWGAITFREIGLLVDEKNTSTAAKELVAIVIAHELAHQWFGNLVTMEWWTHLWLNEGFASYIPYLAIDHIFPKWHIWDQFATDDLSIALRLDALKHTHPIEIDVHDPNEIGEIFDAVSYSKGATVIRMLADYLGEKKFQEGLIYYLKKHSYKNASTVHLWEAFEKVSKKPIKKMMAIWTGKSGYPLVTLSEKNGILTATQKRFFSSEGSVKSAKDNTVWHIPLSFTTEKGNIVPQLMTGKKLTIKKPRSTYLKANANEAGLYRVSYDKTLLEALKDPISKNKMSPADRLGVIRDLFSLSEAGEKSTIEALEMALRYKNETEYIVWIEMVSGLRYIANLLYGQKSYENFRKYACSIVAEAIHNIGWESKKDDTHNDALMRTLLLGASSYFGDKKTIEYTKKLFKNRKNVPIHADKRGIVYTAIAREGSPARNAFSIANAGGEKEYAEFLKMYRTEPLHEEKNRILSAMGQFSDIKILKKHLEFIMTDEVRMQDRNGGFASVLTNVHGRKLGWAFLKKNWKKIGEAYGDGNHLLARLISVLNRNTTKESYEDIKKFFKTHSAPAAERTIDQTLEYIDSNIRWLKRDSKKIEKWLESSR